MKLIESLRARTDMSFSLDECFFIRYNREITQFTISCHGNFSLFFLLLVNDLIERDFILISTISESNEENENFLSVDSDLGV